MLNLYFVYNGHCQFFLGTFNNVDDLIERMEDHQWAFSAITHPRFEKHNRANEEGNRGVFEAM